MMKSFFSILILAGLLLPAGAGAQAKHAAAEHGYLNPLLILLVSIVVVFTFGIAILANVLKQLASTHLEQVRKERAAGIIKTMLLFVLLCTPATALWAQESAGAIPARVAVSPFINGIPRTDFYFILSVITMEVLVMLALLYQITGLVKVLRGIPEKAHVPSTVFKRNFLDIFNKSVAIEQEKDIILDHNYDGIHELDNALPPWWKYGFILTIVVAFIYFGYYHGGGGPNQIDEYNEAVAKAEVEKAAYLAKSAGNVDENTVTMVSDANELSAAQTIFQNACAACHLKDGGGSVGPNLTDDYWLHGGSIKDVFKTIKYGWPDKGMKSWKDDYPPRQIAALASYIKSLKGTRPAAPKAPQGELFAEGGDQAIDSSGTQNEPSMQPGDKKENKDNPRGPYAVKGK